jgi:hypothetical protein
MSTIAGRTLIARTPNEVFAFLADPRHEPDSNHAVIAAHKLTPGPIRVGTRLTNSSGTGVSRYSPGHRSSDCGG